ncbi:efflux RND transporter periplasmic adaptor subunit [Sphingomonas sp. HITSZ_GF]|uniref:efflux RND transporter periplasmic adaptor subunit n=1 Tax=Sphingomonas sp. HITSZ_GF TaxID=3037247 RepID=UPI00240E2119|nr:efflux RND transporter periplasmic adaptor subunit [Sphingomonas sp. HITSZ_GF]MDG2533148.1 efflux RND transporter periplasmic adaptor subunit [Sphingomonas sp. HITSZ_GF]
MATDPNQNLDDFLGTPPRPWWRRWLKWGLIAIGVLLVVLLAWNLFGTSKETKYATEQVDRGNLTVTVSATGKLAPTNEVQVGSELSGLIRTVLVDVNDRVVKDQPLALLDTANLDDQIKQSAAQLAAQEALVAQNQATVAQNQANLNRLEEVSRLSGGKVPAKVEMEQARADYQRAVATLRSSQANVVAQRAELSTAKTQRAKAVIRSPVNGVVLVRQIEPGQTVASSLNAPVLFVIAEDLSSMELEVAIDEADVGSVKQGQLASFTVDAFPGKTFPATITRVDLGSNQTVSTSSSSSSSSSTTSSTSTGVVSYAAMLSVANADQQLRPGMTATAEIVTKSKPNVLLVPNAALRFTPAATPSPSASSSGGIAGALVPRGGRRRGAAGQGGAEKQAKGGQAGTQTVYILDAEGKPQAVEVTTGDTDGSVTEVTGGNLKPGDKVITGQLAGNGSGQKRQSGQRRQGGSSGGGSGGQRGGQ